MIMIVIIVIRLLLLQQIPDHLAALGQLKFAQGHLAQILLVLVIPIDERAQVGVERKPVFFKVQTLAQTSICIVIATLAQISGQIGAYGRRYAALGQTAEARSHGQVHLVRRVLFLARFETGWRNDQSGGLMCARAIRIAHVYGQTLGHEATGRGQTRITARIRIHVGFICVRGLARRD